jgi:hypothetical protein
MGVTVQLLQLSIGGLPMDFFHSAFWHAFLQILQNPIYAGILTVFFVILLIRKAWGLIKIVLGLAIIAGFVWLLLTNRGFAQVIVELLRGVFSLLLFILIALVVLAVVLILGVTVMYVVANPSRTRRPLATGVGQRFRPEFRSDHLAYAGADDAIVEQMQRFDTLFSELQHISKAALDIDESQGGVSLLLHGIHAVLFGMREHLEDLKNMHQVCNDEMDNMIEFLSMNYPEARIEELEAIRQSKAFFPKEGEWESLDDIVEDGKVRFVMRLLFLNRGWREWFTILFKVAVSMETLTQCLDL